MTIQDDTASRLTDALVKIPFLLYALGFVVHAFYLSKYSVLDHGLLQPRFIMIGGLAILLIASALLVITVRVGFQDFKANFSKPKLTAWISRTTCFLLLSSFAVSEDHRILTVPAQSQVAPYIDLIDTFVFIGLLGLGSLVVIDFGLADINHADKEYALFVSRLEERLAPLLVILAVLAACTSEPARDLGIFFLFLVTLFVAGTYGLLDAKAGRTLTPLDPTEDRASHTRWTIAFFPAICVMCVAIVAAVYSRFVYPHLSSSIGGGRLVSVEVILKDGTRHGELLVDGEQWVTILEQPASKVTRIHVDQILEIRNATAPAQPPVLAHRPSNTPSNQRRPHPGSP